MYNMFKVQGVRIDVRFISSLLHSVEDKNIRTLSLGIQNDDKAIIKLTLTAVVIL